MENLTDRWVMPVVVDTSQGVNTYKAYIRHETWYMYDDETLPDFMKRKVAAIGAYSAPRMDEIRKANSRYSDAIYVFEHQPFPPEFSDIGWRCSQDLYMLSLSESELYRVLDDAGIQDKSQGQESIG